MLVFFRLGNRFETIFFFSSSFSFTLHMPLFFVRFTQSMLMMMLDACCCQYGISCYAFIIHCCSFFFMLVFVFICVCYAQPSFIKYIFLRFIRYPICWMDGWMDYAFFSLQTNFSFLGLSIHILILEHSAVCLFYL